jgi:uncharacterized protein (TIGR03086 family)
MTEISERYRARAERFAETIAAVPADGWSNASPCTEWTAADVARHVVDTCSMFEGLVARPLTTRPSAEDDAAGAFDAAWHQVYDELNDPKLAEEEFDGFFGRTSFESAVDRFLSIDLVIHRWDLAKAIGGDLEIPAADVEAAFAAARAFGDTGRSPGVFGEELQAPEGSDEQTRMLAYVGRKAW